MPGLENPAEIWVSTDEAEDVAGSIRHVLRAAETVRDDPQSWKWVALGLHSALQGACVCHLTTSAAPIGAVTKENAREWIAYVEESRTNPSAKTPKTHLMALPLLLKAIRKPKSAGDRSNADGVTVSDPELSWLCRFHRDIRNQFVHFEPRGWAIEVSGIPELAKLISRIILEMLNIGYAFRHQNADQAEELRQNLRALASREWLT
jgi:hypothetical protein